MDIKVNGRTLDARPLRQFGRFGLFVKQSGVLKVAQPQRVGVHDCGPPAKWTKKDKKVLVKEHFSFVQVKADGTTNPKDGRAKAAALARFLGFPNTAAGLRRMVAQFVGGYNLNVPYAGLTPGFEPGTSFTIDAHPVYQGFLLRPIGGDPGLYFMMFILQKVDFILTVTKVCAGGKKVGVKVRFILNLRHRGTKKDLLDLDKAVREAIKKKLEEERKKERERAEENGGLPGGENGAPPGGGGSHGGDDNDDDDDFGGEEEDEGMIDRDAERASVARFGSELFATDDTGDFDDPDDAMEIVLHVGEEEIAEAMKALAKAAEDDEEAVEIAEYTYEPVDMTDGTYT